MSLDPTDIQRRPTGLRTFRGPEILGRKVMPESDAFSENVLVPHREKFRPVAIRYRVTKSGDCIAAYFVTPVARVKLKLEPDGSPVAITLATHPAAQPGIDAPIIVKADIEKDELKNIMKFTQFSKNNPRGVWMPAQSFEDERSFFEISMLKSHLSVYEKISSESIADFKRIYSTRDSN